MPSDNRSLASVLGRPGMAASTLAIVMLAFYGNSLPGGFTYDDNSVLADAAIHQAGLQSPACWVPPKYYLVTGELSYRPIVTLSYFLQGKLSGLGGGGPGAAPPRFSAFGFKAGNWILHFFAALLLWRLARRWLDPLPALFAALLFGVYPATTEAVNAVGFREEMLVAVFLLSSTLIYLRWCATPGRKSILAVSLACFAAGILSKETAYVLPGLLLLTVAAWGDRPRTAATWAGLMPFAALALVAGGVFLVLLRCRYETHYAWLAGYDGARWTLAGPLLAAHLRTLIWPHPLIADRAFLASNAGQLAPMFLTIGVGLALAAAFLLALRRGGVLLAALAWGLAPLAPVLGLVRLDNPVADRYCYVPSLGIGLLGGWAASRLLAGAAASRSRKRNAILVALLLACLIAVCGTATARRNAVWRSDAALWTTTLAQNPRSVKANDRLGVRLMRDGRPAEAIPYLAAACASDPLDSRLQEHLAVAHAMAGRVAEGIEIAERAARSSSRRPSLLHNLSLMHMDKPSPSPERAWTYYRQAAAAGAARDPALESRIQAALRVAVPAHGAAGGAE